MKTFKLKFNFIFLSVIFAGGLFFWQSNLIDYFVPNNFGFVEPGLIYRSGRMPPNMLKKMVLKYNIRKIIDLRTGNFKIPFDNVEKVNIPLFGNGTGKIENYVKAVCEIYEASKNQKPVLVHCAAGAQRTGGVIAVYRLLVQNKDEKTVLDEMMRHGFKPQSDISLKDFLNNNMPIFAVMLKQRGIISNIPYPIPEIRDY